MQQRGRKSSFSVVPISVDGAPARLKPPPSLSSAERAAFIELIAACSPKHFVEADIPLLVSFVQATLISRALAAQALNDASVIPAWEKAVRVQATLATRLRLSPQSRTDPQTIARQQRSVAPQPWGKQKEAS